MSMRVYVSGDTPGGLLAQALASIGCRVVGKGDGAADDFTNESQKVRAIHDADILVVYLGRDGARGGIQNYVTAWTSGLPIFSVRPGHEKEKPLSENIGSMTTKFIYFSDGPELAEKLKETFDECGIVVEGKPTGVSSERR